MTIHIEAHGFELSGELREAVIRDIAELLQAVAHTVNRVSVQLYDDEGTAPRGLDKRCRIRIEFDDEVVIEDSDSEANFDAGLREVCVKLLRDELRAHSRNMIA